MHDEFDHMSIEERMQRYMRVMDRKQYMADMRTSWCEASAESGPLRSAELANPDCAQQIVASTKNEAKSSGILLLRVRVPNVRVIVSGRSGSNLDSITNEGIEK